MTFAPDLAAYFERTGYAGPREPTLDTLSGIVARHVESIPFENLDVLLGRDISLDPAAVEQKLVRQGRGGYCFEQNSLLLHVLGWLYPTVTSRGGVFHHTALDTRWAAYPLWSAETAMTVFTAILTARVVGAITQAQRWSTQAQRWTQTRSSAR